MELKNNTLFKETCFIGGKWIESNSGEKIKVDNPANNEIIGEVPKCSTSETRKAIDVRFEKFRFLSTKKHSSLIYDFSQIFIKIFFEMIFPTIV